MAKVPLVVISFVVPRDNPVGKVSLTDVTVPLFVV